jgi:hypothetical protein
MKSGWSRCWRIFVVLVVAALAVAQTPEAGNEITTKRISSRVIDLGKVHKLYMVYGLGTALILPESISAVIPGNSTTLKIERKEPENLLALRLTGGKTAPTNLIVLTRKSRIVFDVIPNGKIHQDTLEVLGTYGGANFEDEDAKLIYSGKL